MSADCLLLIFHIAILLPNQMMQVLTIIVSSFRTAAMQSKTSQSGKFQSFRLYVNGQPQETPFLILDQHLIAGHIVSCRLELNRHH
jgi:hypothetical protein